MSFDLVRGFPLQALNIMSNNVQGFLSNYNIQHTNLLKLRNGDVDLIVSCNQIMKQIRL